MATSRFRWVSCAVHFSHAALAHSFENLVVRDGLADHRTLPGFAFLLTMLSR